MATQDPDRVDRLLQQFGAAPPPAPVESPRVQNLLEHFGAAEPVQSDRVGRVLERTVPGPLPSQEQWLAQRPSPVQQLGYDDGDSFLQRAGRVGSAVGKSLYESVAFWQPELTTKQRALRFATLGTMFIPFGGTAAIAGSVGAKAAPWLARAVATRKGAVAATALQEALIGGGLAKAHGESVLAGAGLGAVVGGGMQRFILRGRAGLNAARSRVAAQAFRDPARLVRLSDTPLANTEYAILTSQRREMPAALNAERFELLGKELRQRGYEPLPSTGFEPLPIANRVLDEETGMLVPAGKPPADRFREDSFVVPGLTEREAVELGRKYGQDSIITHRGLIDLRDGTLRPLLPDRIRFNGAVSEFDDYFSELSLNGKRTIFALGFSDRPEKLGETLMRRPEQLIAPAVRTGPGAEDFVVGFNHGDAAERAAAEFADIEHFEPGWVTETGRFVSEAEADALRQAGSTEVAIDAMRAEPGAWERVLTRVSQWPVGQRLEKFYNDYVNQWFGFYRFERQLGKRPAELTVDQSLSKLAQLSHGGYGSIAEHNLKWGLVAHNDPNRVLRPGLYEILGGDEARGLPGIRAEDFDSFIRYGFARRWLAIARNTGRQLPVKPSGERFTEAELQSLIATAPRTFATVFDQVVDWRNTLLREYLGNSGILTKKNLNAILTSEDFVPLRRGLDELVERANLSTAEDAFSIWSPVKRLRAMGDKYIDWLEVLQKETVLFAKLSADQRVLNRLMTEFKQLDPAYLKLFARKLRMPPPRLNKLRREAIEQLKHSDPQLASMVEGMDTEILALLAPEKLTGGRHIIGGLDRGKRVWYEINDPLLWDSIRSMGAVELGLFSRLVGSPAVSAPARWLRAGATLAFEFMARNPVRDVMFALTTAGADVGILRAPLVALQRFGQGFASALHQDEWYKAWVAAGGPRAALVSMDRSVLRQDFARSTGLRPGGTTMLTRVVKSPLDALRAFSELTESGTRLGHFKAQYNKLMDEGWAAKDALEEAALRSRNISVDFRVHGLKTAALARASAFWNPMIQGYRQAGISFANDPAALYRAISYITVPSIMLYALNRRDPDYFELPSWERAMFWHIKIPGDDPASATDDHWIRIPKPFELGMVFGTLPEKLLEAMDQSDPAVLDKAAEDFLTGQATELLPIPTMLQPLIERLMNKSWFTGRPIIPRGQEDVAPRYREKPSTSEFAKGLVRFLGLDALGIDAPTVDHFLWSYTGGLGRTATQWSDLLLTDEQLTENDLPVVKGFLSRFPEDNQAAEEFYQFAGKVREASTTAAKLERELRLDELENYYQDHSHLLAALPWTNKVAAQLASLRHQRELIEQNHGLDFDARREIVDEIVDQEYRLLLGANQLTSQIEALAPEK